MFKLEIVGNTYYIIHIETDVALELGAITGNEDDILELYNEKPMTSDEVYSMMYDDEYDDD